MLRSNRSIFFMRPFLLILFVFLCQLSFGQDTIYMINEQVIYGKVKTVTPKEISFKNNSTDTDVTVKRNEVALIVYKNGEKEKINFNRLRGGKNILFPGNSDYKNLVEINFVDIAFLNASVAYERFFKEGTWGIKIPVSFGVGGRAQPNEYNIRSSLNVDYIFNRIWGTGLEINYYPYQQKRYTMFIGLEGNVGHFNYYTRRMEFAYYNSNGNAIYVSKYDKHVGAHYSGTMHLGGIIGLSDRVFLGGKLGVGIKAEETIYSDYSRYKARIDINLGYRF